jgi:hypothetical protein
MARLSIAATGRIVIAELALARFPGVTADALRTIPLGRVETWANGPGRDDVVSAIENREALSEPERARIDGQARAEPDLRVRFVTSPEALAAQEAMRANAADPGVTEQLDAGEVAMGPGPVVLRSRVRNLKLRVPEGQPKPDSFYKDVARLYGEVALNTPQPAVVIAKANGVPVRRVHGWVKEARRRGLMAPGERQARRQQ